MSRNRVVFAALVIVVAYSGCSRDGNGGETHWLGECVTDADCRVGQCLCGACTRSCKSDDDCGGPLAAQCFLTASPGVANRCGTPPPGDGICLATCSGNSGCPGGEVCHLGACVADPPDAASVDGGPTASQIASKYVKVDAGTGFGTPVEVPPPRTLIVGGDDSLIGTWSDYMLDGTPCTPENFDFDLNPTVCMQLEIRRDAAQGGLVATVHWLRSMMASSAIPDGPFAKATDPNAPYPFEDANRNELFVDFPEQEYRVFDGTFKDGTFTFWTSTMDLWTDWRALQTPHPYHVGSVSGYRCVPDPPPPDTSATKVMLCSSRLDYATCGHGKEACNVCGADAGDPACIDLDAACLCTAEDCTANLRSTAAQFQFVMTGTTMRGHFWMDVMPADTPYEADNIHLRKVSP